MKQNLIHISIWLMVIIYMILSLSFVSSQVKEVNCADLSVDIVDYDETRFVNKKDITKLLERNNYNYIGKRLTDLNTSLAEKLLYRFPAIKQVEAYTTINGMLNIRIEQRKPLLRIINKDLTSHYIDADGIVMPLSENFSAYTLIVNGNIEEHYKIQRNQSVFTFDSSGKKVPTLISDIYELSKFIANDDLWHSQIEQVYVSSDKEFILIPRVGAQIILFGDISNYQKKFKKLKAIYKVMNTIGWNKYKVINLKYKNQVICTKK